MQSATSSGPSQRIQSSSLGQGALVEHEQRAVLEAQRHDRLGHAR